MALGKDALRRIVLVAHAADAGFVELVGMAELDRTVAFRGAAMRGVNLRRQDLSGFDFEGGNFDEADVTGADLSRALGLTVEMFRHAIFDRTTRWSPEMQAAIRKLRDGAQTDGFWAPDAPPEWADDWGTDEHGWWVSFSVTAADGTHVIQRMRWIPPGRFMIGSPQKEKGRFDDEGPQQELTIADGFWLFDTACTEALWKIVTDIVPKHRRGPSFPVTGVSWDDVQRFIERLNAAKPGLALSLPSEARWEYACRAGTTTPYNFGTNVSKDYVCFANEAPLPVGSLPPNRWGLYEMHGNVWEWCADCWHYNYRELQNDGSAWLARAGAGQVTRGGSWRSAARSVRSARRDSRRPLLSGSGLGFRCARVQSGRELLQVERGEERRKPGERSEAAATNPKPVVDTCLLSEKRAHIISVINVRLGTTYVRKRAAHFWNARRDKRIICTISMHHNKGLYRYKFRYDQDWHNFLMEPGISGHLVLGCMGLTSTFVIPADAMAPLLGKLHAAMFEGRVYSWNLRVTEPTSGSYALAVPNSQPFVLDPYRVPLE